MMELIRPRFFTTISGMSAMVNSSDLLVYFHFLRTDALLMNLQQVYCLYVDLLENFH
jgi:hypothetical protein